MFPTLKKLFLGHKPYQSTEDRQLQHKETFILNLSVVVFLAETYLANVYCGD